jgi:hypothetical protein
VRQTSEALGLFLAAVACSLPSVGRRLKVRTATLSSVCVCNISPFSRLVAGVCLVVANFAEVLMLQGGEAGKEGNKGPSRRSLFELAHRLSGKQKQELAWGSFALLQNTKTSAVVRSRLHS